MEKDAKSEAVVRRCAKAALLLYSLNSTNSEDEKKWKREIHDLKRQLLKERLMKKKIKLCAFMEFVPTSECFFSALSKFGSFA
ncbi:hypothetical protein CR513_42025, partial [Mucuna pruriens]